MHWDILTGIVVDKVDANNYEKSVLDERVEHDEIWSDYNCCDKEVMSRFAALVKLAKKGDTDKLLEILREEKLNVNELDSKSGQGLLHIAI